MNLFRLILIVRSDARKSYTINITLILYMYMFYSYLAFLLPRFIIR